jgi:hypothetical protein
MDGVPGRASQLQSPEMALVEVMEPGSVRSLSWEARRRFSRNRAGTGLNPGAAKILPRSGFVQHNMCL